MIENNKPLVSIISPMYNVEKYIEPFVCCILNQTYQNWELILVDDGSTDNTLSILQKFSDERIVVLHRNRLPKGSVTCRNIGQNFAKGEYFIHFDSDDLIEPFCIEQRVKFMSDNPGVDFATFKGGTVIVREDGSLEKGNKKWGAPINDDDLRSFLCTKYPYSVWNNIYRQSSFQNYWWDEKVKIYTDFSYIIPSIIQGKQHAYDYASNEDYYYRIGQRNAMTSSFISEEKYSSTKYLFDKTIKSLDTIPNCKIYKKYFYQFYKLHFLRIILNGLSSQVHDFYCFTLLSFKDQLCIAVKLAYFFSKPLLKKEDALTKTLLKIVTYTILHPSYISKWIKQKTLSILYRIFL